MTAQASALPSENWDDDFEFSQSNSNDNSNPKDIIKPEPVTSPPLQPHVSVTSSCFPEDWDADDRPRHPLHKARVLGSSRTGVSSRLDNWAELGPSTPTKHGGTQVQTENWDDDFEDKADSPSGRRHHTHKTSRYIFQHNHPTHALRTRHSYHTPPRPKPPVEPENWDDDFYDPMDPTSSTSPSKGDNDNTPMTKRTRRAACADTSDEDDDADLGFSEDKEEDKTLTARSRTAPMLRGGSSNSHSHSSSHHSPIPIPALPHALSLSPTESFPRSPTVSVFSIPTTSGRNSIGYFNSTSHLVLSGAASSLAMIPPSPPTQRERRRLRKKSRPPHMDHNVFELIEEQRDSSSPPLPPSTPERERASSPPIVPMMLTSSIEGTPRSGGSKTPLLSRIGAVKKWGVRRKRASTGPGEVMMQEFGTSNRVIVEDETVPRPPSSVGQRQAQTPSNRNQDSSNTSETRSTWFFRPGGAHYGTGSPSPGEAELRHEKSPDQTRLRPGTGTSEREGGGQVPTTPNKSGKLSRRKASGLPPQHISSGELTGDGSSSASGMGVGKPSLGPSRRPTSMQVPNGAALAIGNGINKFASIGTRHASYGSSVGRTSSSRVFSTPTPTESAEDLPSMPALEGSRGLKGSMRKISLVGGKKHKKRKSSVEIAYTPPVPAASLQNDIGDDKSRVDDADGDSRMQTSPQAYTPGLLPPIELHPPSPPRTIGGVSTARSIPLNISDSIEPMIPSMSAPPATTMSPVVSSASPVASSKATPKTPSSPQSASLGRTTQVPNPPPLNASVPRRNSLGDLKIPARISQAQIGLKRDLGLVREFATSIDGLKELQSTYYHLLAEVQTTLEIAPPSRATSPNVFSLVRPHSRLRSNTSPSNTNSSSPHTFSEHKHITSTLQAIIVKYKISWECAELLIELGGGAPSAASPASAQSSSLLPPVVLMQAELDRRGNRERAVTLSGEESKSSPVALISSATTSTALSTSSPPNPSWHASMGRHDLSQRQLVLLRDMLSSGELPPDDVPLLEENVNRNWRWGDAMSSTVTLPSEESGSRGTDHGEGGKKKRHSRRIGLAGLRDMLRMLKRSHSEQVSTPPLPTIPSVPSAASLSTNSSHCSHHYPHAQLRVGDAHRAPKASTGPESVRSTKDVPLSPPHSRPPLNDKSSPRRPSLASIFRLGHKNKGGASSSAGESSQDSRSDVRSASRGSNMTGEEDDWDRIEPAIDLNDTARALGIEGTATIKGRKGLVSAFLPEHPPGHTLGLTHRPVTPRHGQDPAPALRLEMEASPRSIRPMRSTRLSNVEEVEDGERPVPLGGKAKKRMSLRRASPHRPPSRGQNLGSGRTGSVRSAPPQPVDNVHALPEIKLSMTPENIKPLLENAKEVHERCQECIRDLHALLSTMPVGVSPASAS